MDLLPQHIRNELLYETRKPYMKMHSLFGTIVEHFPVAARNLSRHVFKPSFAISEEIIFDKRDPCSTMRFMATGKTTYGTDIVAADISTDTDDMIKPSDDILNGQKLSYGQWLSDAALFVDWKNQGRLVADFYCCMLEVEASVMAQSLHSYTHAFNAAALFGRALIDSMVQSASALSDVVTVCIILLKTPRRRSSIQSEGD